MSRWRRWVIAGVAVTANSKTNGAVLQLPADGEHTAIWGRTGSGKTQMGAFLLSKKNLRRKPTVILDYKGDELLNSLERVREISHTEVPEKPGVYILHSVPKHDDEKVDAWLWDVWEKEHIDIYVDEGYMLPRNGDAFEALLTQGRSKRIGVTTLSQRPVHVSRFVISEASHVVMFDLNDERDIDTTRGIVPRDFPYWVPPEFGTELPAFHSRWYSVKTRGRFVVRPVPEADVIRKAIDGQLEPKLRWV